MNFITQVNKRCRGLHVEKIIVLQVIKNIHRERNIEELNI